MGINGSNDKTYEMEQAYRQELLQKRKLTPEEKLWLQAHRCYSYAQGYPYLSFDVIELEPNTTYHIQVRFIQRQSQYSFFPVLYAPARQGNMLFGDDATVIDVVKRKRTKKTWSVVAEISPQHPVCSFLYSSPLGKLTLYYQSNTCVHEQQCWPSTMVPKFFMRCQKVEENRYIYSCSDMNDSSVGKYVFSVEWEAIR